MNATPQILVAGIGNIFLGDDAFGSEVARRLLARAYPPNIRIVDFGIRGLDLLYALLDNPHTLILIDAVPRRENPPGTLYILEPQLDSFTHPPGPLETHALDPLKVLHNAIAMGARLNRITIIGCEPTPDVDYDDPNTPAGMSPAVAGAIGPAIVLFDSLLERLNPLSKTEVSSCPNVPSSQNPGMLFPRALA